MASDLFQRVLLVVVPLSAGAMFVLWREAPADPVRPPVRMPKTALSNPLPLTDPREDRAMQERWRVEVSKQSVDLSVLCSILPDGGESCGGPGSGAPTVMSGPNKLPEGDRQ